MGMLLAAAACFSVWLLLEVLRNYPSVGLSAFGEVRTRYLILILPFFAAVSLRDKRAVKSMLNVFVFIGLVLPIILTPLVLYLNGWALSAKGSIFNAQISLGILLCLLVLWTCPSWVRWPKAVVYVCTALGTLEILLDAHRSVWVAAIMAIGFLALSSPGVTSNVRRLVILSLGALLIALLQLYTPLHVWDRVVDQGAAALAVEDTVAWRVAVQKAALATFADSPLTGRGLGLYWDTYVPEFGRVIKVFPHSVYVMVMVHLGVVGTLLLGWLGLASWRGLRAPAASPRPADRACNAVELSRLGRAALLGLIGYGLAYGFESYILLLIGICLAGVLHSGRADIGTAR